MIKTNAAEEQEQNMPQLATQQYMPIQKRRALTDEEHRQIAKGRSQWLPQVFQSYATPIPMMMASPLKQSLLAGLGGGTAGALLGGHIGSNSGGHGGLGALIGGLGVGGVSAAVAGLKRNANNQGLVELMKRLPPNSVKRDLLADPAVQQDQWRDTIHGLGNQFTDDMQAAFSKYSGVSIGLNRKSASGLADNMMQFGDTITPQRDRKAIRCEGNSPRVTSVLSPK